MFFMIKCALNPSFYAEEEEYCDNVIILLWRRPCDYVESLCFCEKR